MSEPRWFEKPPPAPVARRRGGGPTRDLWVRCQGCARAIHRPDLPASLHVCQHCGHHFRMEAGDRIAMLADDGSWRRRDAGLAPVDRLGFADSRAYRDRIASGRSRTGERDALRSGSCTIEGVAVELGVFDFRFMGGSMGSVVGEAITRLFERAAARRRPAVLVSASGGARMQEGVLSLVQMARTCAALGRLREEAGMPFVSVLTDPTTGGVAASFAMLGDLVLAEPGALVGFAGPRVIEQTIGQALPEGFQTSEYLLEHGMIDRIVSRSRLKRELAAALRWLVEP